MTEYILFSSVYGAFSRIDHVLGPRTRLNKFKKTEIIPRLFSEHNGMKLLVNYNKEAGKNDKYVEIKWYATEQLLGQRGNKRRPKDTKRQMKMKLWHIEFGGCNKNY